MGFEGWIWQSEDFSAVEEVAVVVVGVVVVIVVVVVVVVVLVVVASAVAAVLMGGRDGRRTQSSGRNRRRRRTPLSQQYKPHDTSSTCSENPESLGPGFRATPGVQAHADRRGIESTTWWV